MELAPPSVNASTSRYVPENLSDIIHDPARPHRGRPYGDRRGESWRRAGRRRGGGSARARSARGLPAPPRPRAPGTALRLERGEGGRAGSRHEAVRAEGDGLEARIALATQGRL